MMANGANEVRDRISTFLAGREWDPSFKNVGFTEWANVGVSVFVSLDSALVWITDATGAAAKTPIPSDAPDLLERLGETLDGLGV